MDRARVFAGFVASPIASSTSRWINVGVSVVRVSPTRSLVTRHRNHTLQRHFRGPFVVKSRVNDALMSGGVPLGAASGIDDLPLERIPPRGQPLPQQWSVPGVYGVYGADEELKYVAAVTNIAEAINVHRDVLQDDNAVYGLRIVTIGTEDDRTLSQLAYNWVVAHTKQGPGAPPGNTDLAPEWRVEPDEKPQAKQEEPDKVEVPDKIEEPDKIEVAAPVDGNVWFSPSAREEDAGDEIKRIVENHKVVLFMKGTRDGPRCGFSNSVVQILKSTLGDKFVCVDCLDASRNPGLRQGIKTFSDWPTIPQLYLDSDFVGGADIVASLHESGDLAAEFEKADVPVLA